MRNTIKHVHKYFYIITGVTVNGRDVNVWEPTIHINWKDAIGELERIYKSYVIDESDSVEDSWFYGSEGRFYIIFKDDTYMEGRIYDGSIDENEDEVIKED